MSQNELMEAEVNVIGSLFIEPKLVHEVIEKVDIDAFTFPNDKIIQVIEHIVKGESQQFKKVGVLTVYNVLQQRKLKVTQKYIRDIVGNIVTTDDFNDSLNMVADGSVRTNMEARLKVVQLMIRSKENLDDVIANIDKTRRDINDQIARFIKQPDISDHLSSADIQIKKIIANRGKMTGIPSGFPRWDFFTGGFQTELIIIGGRPSMGKTALALDVVRHSIFSYGYKPGFFSYEMTVKSLMMRMICTDARVSFQNIKHGKVTESEKVNIARTMRKFNNLNMYIDDTQYDIDVLVSKIETVKEQYGIDYAVIDYIQLVPANRKFNRSREEEVSYIIRTLKATVKRLDMPIIVLAQLSRRSARKGAAQPTLDELRESGSLEQDADLVIFIHRPYYYGVIKRGGKSMINVAEIIIAKQRNGPTGVAELFWNSKFASFENPAMHWLQIKGVTK